MITVFTQFLQESWGKAKKDIALFAGFFASQVGVQMISLISGFMIIRILSKDQYFAYTIINTLGPVMLMLSDNGIGTGLSTIGRHSWEDNRVMGSLINTGLQLRRKFALFSFIVVGPVLVWMLYRRGVDPITISLLTIATVAGVSFQLSSAIMRMVLEWRQNLKSLGKVSFGVALVRLALVVFFCEVFQLSAFLATLAATCSFILETYFIARAVRCQVVWDAPPNPEYYPTIYSKVKQTLPLTVYFCFQSQISIWLISIFGSAHQTADIGSASRLNVIFATIVGSFGMIMIPRFARNNGRKLLYSQVGQILGAITTLLVLLSAFTWLFPQPFVWLLGEKYQNMTSLIWLVILSSGMYTVANVVYGLNMAKGWIPPAYLTIPVEVLTQITLLLIFDLSKTQSVLLFFLFGTIPPTLLNLWLLLRRLREEPE
jgi:O-antigen/teichoic acid export membrane protein